MEHGQLIEALILFPLFLDVLADAGFVAPDGRDVVAPRPKVLPEEVLSAAKIRAGDVEGALALHEPDDLRHGILRGNRQQHVHVVGEEMPLLPRTLLLPGQLPEYCAQVLPEAAVQDLPTTLGNSNDTVLALPPGVG